MFQLLIENSDILAEQFSSLENHIIALEEKGTDEVQEFQQRNVELEAELDLMEAELEKMRVYEQSYHTQEQRLKTSLEQIDQSQHERMNIETAHHDLLTDFEILKR